MEIPHTEAYSTVEKESSIDFLSENIDMTFSFEDEALAHLPGVSDEDLITGQERYAVLLGHYEQVDVDKVNIRIRGVMQNDENEEDKFYREDTEAVHTNLQKAKGLAESLQATSTDYTNFQFIGDIHTHPIRKENLLAKNISACTPSDNDIQDIISEYENGVLLPEKPFVFGIVGRRHDETEEQYAFYRLVKDDNGYKTIGISKK